MKSGHRRRLVLDLCPNPVVMKVINRPGDHWSGIGKELQDLEESELQIRKGELLLE